MNGIEWQDDSIEIASRGKNKINDENFLIDFYLNTLPAEARIGNQLNDNWEVVFTFLEQIGIR